MKRRYKTAAVLIAALMLSFGACQYKQNTTQTINLANDVVAEFVGNYQIGNSAKYAFQGDRYAMKGATLYWDKVEGASAYKILLSREKTMSEPILLETVDNMAIVQDLFVATKYYWQVSAVTEKGEEKTKVQEFITADTPRTIFLEGVSNTRDIGGRIGLGDRRVKQGMVYRGAHLNEITETGKKQAVQGYGIKTELDLRNSEEIGKTTASPFGESVRYVNISCPYYAEGNMSIFTKTTEMALVLKEFAKAENYPMYYHCVIGRDRTGTVSMLLQGLLGVSEKDILMDYEMSFFSDVIDETPVETMLQYIENTMRRVRYPNIYSPENREDIPFSTCCEEFMLSIGVTDTEIAAIRNILLE